VTSTAFSGIGSLITLDPALGDGELGELTNAAMVVESGRIVWVGASTQLPAADMSVDLHGRAVVPGFVDSHAHMIFAGDRAAEFEARMTGSAYSAGGIRTTVAATRAATDSQLKGNYERLVAEMAASGITTFETKSGYGLTSDDELRSLRIAASLTDEVTLLAAHVVPAEYSDAPDDYVDLVCSDIIPKSIGVAKWVDAFCDRGAFDLMQTRRIFAAAVQHGMQLRIHANQLQSSETLELITEFDIASADHCTHLRPRDIELLVASDTVATLLPGAEFSTRSPYPNARALLDAGAVVAIATDCNPGSSYTTSMPFCIAVAVREMKMSPAEALRAATLGGATSLRRSDVGSLEVGKSADFAVLDAPSYVHLAYRPGVNLISQTWKAGNLISSKGTK